MNRKNKKPDSRDKKHRQNAARALFSCTNISNFVDSVVRIFPFSGASGAHFFLCEHDGVRYFTKLCFYHKSVGATSRSSGITKLGPVDTEIRLLEIFRKNIINANRSPCIIELVYHKICEHASVSIPPDVDCDGYSRGYTTNDEIADKIYETFCHQRGLIENGLAFDRCAYMVLERCDMDFSAFLAKDMKLGAGVAMIRAILFMVIHTMYVIQSIYPSFRHNDLHGRNVLLKVDTNFVFNMIRATFLDYSVAGETYYVPYFGIVPKIIDFAYSSLPEEGVISDQTKNKTFMHFRTSNDVLFLLHSVYYSVRGTEHELIVHQMLDHLDPSGLHIMHDTSYIKKVSDELLTYEQMLQSDAFAQYRGVHPPRGSIIKSYARPQSTKRRR